MRASVDSLDFRAVVAPGDGVVWGQGCGEPTPLVAEFLRQSGGIGRLRAFAGLSYTDVLLESTDDTVEIVSYGALGRMSRLARARQVDIVPCHVSALPALFASRAIPGDIALIQVSPAGSDGCHSLGVTVDYLAAAVENARVVVAEVNDRMPSTRGPRIPREKIDIAIASSRPLVSAPSPGHSAVHERIAAHAAGLVEDGDTIQMGIGGVPETTVRALRDHRALGVHSGSLGPAIAEIVDAGAVTGERKGRDRGQVVGTTALGTEQVFDFVARPDVRLEPVTYTHSPALLAELGPLVAINGAIEVDLCGQVNAEIADGRAVGAVGGQVDFVRAAPATGGRAIIGLPAVAPGGCSAIVPRLPHGVVTTARSDVDWIVTDYGAAQLRGRTLRERAAALVELAHPDHREALEDAARRLSGGSHRSLV